VDRRALAQIVFASNSELRHLEAITHPAIAAEILRRVDESSRPVIVEVPLQHLVLPGDWCKAAVIADEGIRIVRAVERGGDPADIRRRVSSQVSDDEWTEWADIVIDNSGSWEGTRNHVDNVIDELDA
jgi:dephospho-CoA kinase